MVKKHVESVPMKTNPLTLSGKSINDNMNFLITDQLLLTSLANQNLLSVVDVKGFNINTEDGLKTGLKSIIDTTPLKAGCCMRNKTDDTERAVSVRVPLQSSTTNEYYKEFGFQINPLIIKSKGCPSNLYKGSPDCDAFYDVYCSNINNVFSEQFGPNYDVNVYQAFAPECSCYAPRTIGEEAYPPGIPSACFKIGCSVDSTDSYPDPTSRNQPCDATICSSIVNVEGVTAGGSVTVSPTIVQQCGSTTTTAKTNTESVAGNINGTSETETKTKTDVENSTNVESEKKVIPPNYNGRTETLNEAEMEQFTEGATKSTVESETPYLGYEYIFIVVICLLLLSSSIYFMMRKK